MIETRNRKPMNRTKATRENPGIERTWKKPNSVIIVKTVTSSTEKIRTVNTKSKSSMMSIGKNTEIIIT